MKLSKWIAAIATELATEVADAVIAVAVMELSSVKLAVVIANSDALRTIASCLVVYLDWGFWLPLGFGLAEASITPARAVSCKQDMGGEYMDCNCGGRFYYDEGASCWVCESCGRDPSGETV